MAAGTSPIYVSEINNKAQTWTNADTAATVKDVFIAAPDGSRLASIAATSTDTAALDVQILLNDGTTVSLVGTVTVPGGAGNTGSVAAVNLLGSLSALPWLNADGSVTIPAGWTVQCKNVTQVSAGKTLALVTIGGNY